MGTSTVRATPTQLIESLRVQELQAPDFAGLIELVTRPQLSYLCVAPGHLRRAATTDGIDWAQGTIVAANADGVVGFALIEGGRDSKTGQLTMAVDPAWARGPAPAKLVEEAAAFARRLGFEKVETQVCRETSLGLFQDAGLRTLSSMSAGGVTDVALAVA
jgi:hypothetical protein